MGIDNDIAARIVAALTPDLRKPGYSGRRLAGYCYVASEAYYHMSGGKAVGLVPCVIRHEGVSHWFLKDENGEVIDLTAGQFESPVPYGDARRCPFLTAQPSRRAAELMRRAGRAN